MEDSKDLLFAVFKGEREITEAMFKEVKNFTTYIAQREKKEK